MSGPKRPIFFGGQGLTVVFKPTLIQKQTFLILCLFTIFNIGDWVHSVEAVIEKSK